MHVAVRSTLPRGLGDRGDVTFIGLEIEMMGLTGVSYLLTTVWSALPRYSRARDDTALEEREIEQVDVI
ncbi:uncharacterized protein BDZ99DRAFT_192961 [Mytilinidion resinicola]|uniref:Uncharacterized protein n=1 Tax=Mytilinidion resinicola TaxID=574789 RepID=A0A6A6Z4R4_9PEZI|nr:uncharacterized protein BDZ99DRAFT_192961 [Mytilinidion resinicola]KAF2815247.1 hypothetical protein BDZ99DRAFT_192961 [Mytilinidion resinicola]